MNLFYTFEIQFKIQDLSLYYSTAHQCNFFKWDGKITKIWHLIFHRIWKKNITIYTSCFKRTLQKSSHLNKKKWVSWVWCQLNFQEWKLQPNFSSQFSANASALWASIDLSTLEDAWMLNGICRHVQKKMKVEPSCCTKKLSQKFDLHCS